MFNTIAKPSRVILRKPLIWLMWKVTRKRVGRRVVCLHFAPDKVKFGERMEWLARNYRIVSLSRLLERDVDETTLALTFDDWSETWFTNVMPVLSELKVHATFFINEKGEDLYDRIMTHKDHFLWTVGGHTRNHVMLSRYAYLQPRYLATEIEPRRLFAYPYGTPKDYNRATVRFLENHPKIKYALTTIPGWVEDAPNDYELPRDCLRLEDPTWFWRAKLAGAYDWLYRIRHRRSWR